MHKIRVQKVVAVIVFMCFTCLVAASASAHRVNVFAWVEGDTIYVESKFAGGKTVKSGKIVVMDPQGGTLLSGLTNDQGEFSFRVPRRADLKIVLTAGQGHQGEWIIPAAEIENMPSRTAPDGDAEHVVQPEQNKSVFKTSTETGIATLPSAAESKELEAIIETVLDRKLKPITRMLADIRHQGPTVKDVLAGIGYIMGLVGIAAYAQSRKKKE